MTLARTAFALGIVCILFSGCESSVTDPGGRGGTTRTTFEVPRDASVSLRIENEYNTTAATLLSHKQFSAGTYSVSFDGSKLPSGIYFYVIYQELLPPASGGTIQTRALLFPG